MRLRFIGRRAPEHVFTLDKAEANGEFNLTYQATPGAVGSLTQDKNEIKEIKLTSVGQKTYSLYDDKLIGTYGNKAVEFTRYTRSRRPIEIRMPGDRPWVRFMQEILIPKTAEDRETFHIFRAKKAGAFLRSCKLYDSGYWQRKYFKGATKAEKSAAFDALIERMHRERVSPRTMMRTAFRRGLDENLSEDTKAKWYGLAASGLGMYFSTAAGGSVRIIVTDNRDSIIYYITDTRRTQKLGLVVMDTPAHLPLASSFGRWLLDFGAMPKEDDSTFARGLLETLAMSSSRAANALSDMGKSAYTDYLGVMAIEDQRGVMFNNAGLKWGLNMTNGSFTALIVRALSHGETRPGPIVPKYPRLKLDGRDELASQVIVGRMGGYSLQPGEPSYFDTLNGADNVLEGNGTKGGNDLQEGDGMRKLKQLTTDWLRAKHPAKVERVEEAFAAIMPLDQISEPARARSDVFHLMADYFYEPKMAEATPAQAQEMVDAGVDLLNTVSDHSRDLEAFILANGVTKSTGWAPRASGY